MVATRAMDRQRWNGLARVVVAPGMRRLPTLLVLALVLAACSTVAAEVAVGGAIQGEFTNDASGGLVAPDFTFTLHDGTEFRLSDQEEPVLVVFWADWCPNCARELPAIDEAVEDHAVKVLAIGGRGDIDRAAEKAGEWLTEGNVVWGYDEDHDLWELFGVTGTPTNVFLLPDGSVMGFQPGRLPEASLDDILGEFASFG